jgi:hypothetical protein
VACDGRVWNVGNCGGVELSADGTTSCGCSTSAPGYLVRPCEYSWGGVNTPTCYGYGPTQTMTVVCE